MSGIRKTVLILDDDYEVRESLINYFEDQEWRVLSASNVEEALQLLEDDPPHGAVVDIRMPGKDGIFFLQHFNEILPQLACVICTGSPLYNFQEGFIDMQNISHKIFNKPVMDLEALEEELLHLIEG